MQIDAALLRHIHSPITSTKYRPRYCVFMRCVVLVVMDRQGVHGAGDEMNEDEEEEEEEVTHDILPIYISSCPSLRFRIYPVRRELIHL